MSATVGLIGLGAMGAGMAQSRRRAGHAPHVFDARADAAEAFAQDGGKACASPAALGEICHIVVSVVVNAAQTEAVLFGEQGCAATMKPGSVCVPPLTRTGQPRWKRGSQLRAFCTSMRPSQAGPPKPPARRWP